MTTFGVDVSNFQAGLSLTSVKSQGYAFCMALATQGNYFTNKYFAAQRDEAKAAGLLFAAYHFLDSRYSAASQADRLASVIGDKSIPIMIDCEPYTAPSGATSKPRLSHCVAFRDACKARGMQVTLLYYPQWWWSQSGQSSLKGWTVVESEYGNNPATTGSQAYPGDTSARWTAFGGVTPTILQFGSQVKLSGYSGGVDANAFRGTIEQLRNLGLFTDWGMEEDDMYTDADRARDELVKDRLTGMFPQRYMLYDATQKEYVAVPEGTAGAIPERGLRQLDGQTINGVTVDSSAKLEVKIDALTSIVGTLANNPDITPEEMKTVINDSVNAAFDARIKDADVNIVVTDPKETP